MCEPKNVNGQQRNRVLTGMFVELTLPELSTNFYSIKKYQQSPMMSAQEKKRKEKEEKKWTRKEKEKKKKEKVANCLFHAGNF